MGPPRLTIRDFPTPLGSCEKALSTPNKVTYVRPALCSAPITVITVPSAAIDTHAIGDTPATCSVGVSQASPVPKFLKFLQHKWFHLVKQLWRYPSVADEMVCVLNTIACVELPMRIGDAAVLIVKPRFFIEIIVSIILSIAAAALRFSPLHQVHPLQIAVIKIFV